MEPTKLMTEKIKLRNTAITLLHSLGFSRLEIANLFGLAEKTVENIYGGQGTRVIGGISLLTLGEVARFLHLHPNTVRRWADAGKLPTVRFGSRGDRRFRREDLEKFVRRGGNK